MYYILKDTEELNLIFMICNQNADPSATYPLFGYINIFLDMHII